MDITNYKKKVEVFFNRMSSVDESKASIKLSNDKWALKEMTGHLIDSASNNHQRFIRLQETAELSFPLYAPEFWKDAACYIEYPWENLVQLWHSYNTLILHIVSKVDDKCLDNVWKRSDKDLTLRFLIEDYYAHMQWHIDLFDERLSEITG
jgi:hypothetical protein